MNGVTGVTAMTKWQYMRYPVFEGRGGPDVRALDNLGDWGWELVGFVPDADPPPSELLGFLLFKRPQPAGQQVDDRAFRGALSDPRGPDPKAREL